jgi:DNA-binding CsgD family transcriptional regulator
VLATTEPTGVAERLRTVRVAVESTVVRFALLHVIDTSGWQLCAHTEPCRCLTLADRASVDRPSTVLVVRDAPGPCLESINDVMAGRALGVVLWNEPEALAAVFEAVRFQSTVIPSRAIELATNAPRLTIRQRDTLRLLGAGRSNRAIAMMTNQSISTTKRDIAGLLEIFDVPNRAALITAATALGFVGPPTGSCADYQVEPEPDDASGW